jgi:1,4-alpha-glucan branching enzyme
MQKAAGLRLPCASAPKAISWPPKERIKGKNMKSPFFSLKRIRNIGFIMLMFTLFLLNATALFAANPVSSEPEFPTENDSTIIYFDATAGDGGLMGYTGDIYAHTGVITSSSTGPSDWKYVIADWDVNTEKAKLTRISTDFYSLTIGFPHEFYNVPAAETILKLAFVFRNNTGSLTGRDEGGADIFLGLYEAGITAVFIKPAVDNSFGDPRRSPIFTHIGDTIEVELSAAAIGTEIDSLALFDDNGLKLAFSDSSRLQLDYIVDLLENSNMQTLHGIAYGSEGINDTASVNLMIPQPEIAERPSALQDGITYPDNQSAIFSIFAPGKEHIFLIGDFNNWFVEPDYLLKKDEQSADSVWWWITLEGLNPGEEYAFQYLVDGEIRIADPYSEKILDPWNDKWIPQVTYPDLKPYPTGKTEQAVGVIQPGLESFNWTADFTRPENKDLVIYELLVRDFIARHDYQTLIDTLAYLQNLGINAIELMPVNEFEGNSSWGYNPSFYFAPDKYYGTAADLKAFIDACHERGMAVIIDMVLNHAFGQNVLARLYWNSTENRPAANNPWFNEVSPNPVYHWGSDFNHESKATQYFVDRVNRYWLDEYNVDGFRFDFTKGLTNTPGEGWNHDNARIAILKRMADEIWAFDSSAYVILEHFTANSEETELANYGMMIWGNVTHAYQEAAMGYSNDLSWGIYSNRGWSKPHLVAYMESHDEERIMYKNLQYGNSLGSYNIKNIFTALNRMKLNGAFYFTLPGPKMIWQFGELGYDISIDDPCRVCEKPILWNYFEEEARRNLYKTWSALIKLRSQQAIFTEPDNADYSLNGMLKRVYLSKGGMHAIIIGNFDVSAGEISPNFPYSGQWYDYFSGDTLNASGSMSITLAPGEFHIYTNQKLETPEPGILTNLADDGSLPNQFILYPAFPNPFNAQIQIRYDLPVAQKLSLQIYDIQGRLAAEIFRGYQTAGSYQKTWNAQNESGLSLSSGVYILRLQSDTDLQTQKIVLIK